MTTTTKLKKTEINPGEAKSFQIGDIKVVVCNVDGEYFAIDDICSHDEGVLISDKGRLIENCLIECPRHGARFDVKTGEAKRMPAVAPIKTYNIKAVGEELEIEIE